MNAVWREVARLSLAPLLRGEGWARGLHRVALFRDMLHRKLMPENRLGTAAIYYVNLSISYHCCN